MSLEDVRGRAHPGCVFCGPGAPAWTRLVLRSAPAGVAGGFPCLEPCEGYPGLVHGGLIAGLLDAAMTNALFAEGVAGLTGRLSLRYRRPLLLGRQAEVGARVVERRQGWWRTCASLGQDGAVAAEADAWFRERR